MKETIRQVIDRTWKRAVPYLSALVKWLLLAVVTGVLCGAVGAAFHIGIHEAELLRGQFPWLLWCLPLAGVAIVAFYKLTRTEGQGTNDVIDVVRLGKGLPVLLLPAIFVGTVLTHLCGGSAGREGAALQMGGTIGYHLGGGCSTWTTGICAPLPWWVWRPSLPLCLVRPWLPQCSP